MQVLAKHLCYYCFLPVNKESEEYLQLQLPSGEEVISHSSCHSIYWLYQTKVLEQNLKLRLN